MHVLGLDIGGANIKAADADGRAVSRAFPIWKSPERLRDVLAEIAAEFPAAELFAVTITAELADCFATKADGVAAVLDACIDVANGRPVHVWQTGGEFIPPEFAKEFPLLVAAANWHALATWAGRMTPDGRALLIDIGSTTTDIIPLCDGRPDSVGLTDRERLMSGELVYTGVRRTPLCAIVDRVPFGDGDCPVAAELFATTLDVYLLLDLIDENPADTDTANGRPATKAGAVDRIARAICCDQTECTAADAQRIAEHVAERQTAQILAAVDQVLPREPDPCRQVLISGEGRFLADQVLDRSHRLRDVSRIRLANCLSPDTSRAACAFAVARLAVENL